VQPLRLTLRTLLAYLDDTLEPAQARLMGQKIAESDQARELIERIKTVTRRRRITTPQPDSPGGGKLDANIVGEYLDNTISPEQATEVEEICLASDAHLAEVAASHQILSLILGEPALVPPSAKQRMYALVKGPEAIPFRKPPRPGSKHDGEVSEARDEDDTLRLGIPPVSGRNRGNPWMLAAAGVVVVGLLAFALWQILKGPDTTADPRGLGKIAQLDPNKDKKGNDTEGKKSAEEKKAVQIEEKKSEQKNDEKTEDPQDTKKGETKVELPAVGKDAAFAPPSKVQAKLGKFVADPKNPGILLERLPDKTDWQRIGLKNPEVSSGRTLVSLPASTSTIQLAKGLTLTLVGLTPELFLSEAAQFYESSAELHANDQLDLDLTLRRGRIRIASSRDKPARVRVRFENPTAPAENEFFDITLPAKESEVLFDRWAYFTPGERFYRNPKDPNRLGPTAAMTCIVLTGKAKVRAGDVDIDLTAPPGKALLLWESRKGLGRDNPLQLDKLPDGLTSVQPLPPGLDPRFRKDTLRARDDLSQNMAAKEVDVVLTESLQAQDPATRRLACRSLGAVDDVSRLLDLIDQDKETDLRYAAIDTLRHWIAASRDNDYKVYDLLRMKYRGIESDAIMSLLHYGSQDLSNPDTYEVLIAYLNHPLLPIRELAFINLYSVVPAGQKIRYRAIDDAATRMQAQQEWRKLIPSGKLPPMPKQPMGKQPMK
jgi:hypothetical protein